MEDDSQLRTREEIIRVVTELLECDGYDGVQLRVVAKRARVSLTTIYKSFPTQNHLIVAALERWLAVNCYSRLDSPLNDRSLYESQLQLFRQLFEPWERNPRMLEAYYRARTRPGGALLDLQGAAAAEASARPVLRHVDPAYLKDFSLIVSNLVAGVIERFAVGDLAVTDILPVIERALFRLTTNNEGLTDCGQLDERTESADDPKRETPSA